MTQEVQTTTQARELTGEELDLACGGTNNLKQLGIGIHNLAPALEETLITSYSLGGSGGDRL